MNTRFEILEFLRTHPYSSANALSVALLKTRANIQIHLKKLEHDNLIQRISISSPGKARGRPIHYYSIAPEERPQNIIMLAEVLLGMLGFEYALISSDQYEQKLKYLAANIIPAAQTVASQSQKINQLISDLNTYGYQARWEAHAKGPVIAFRNCPYAPLLPHHQELCQMDRIILEMRLAKPIKQLSIIRIPLTTACRFLVANE